MGFFRSGLKLTAIEIFLIIPAVAILFIVPMSIFFESKYLYTFGDAALESNIAGIFAPFFSFIGSVLVYIAFKTQIKANKEIQSQFNVQNNNQIFFRLIDTLESRITSSEIIHGDKHYVGYNMISKIVDSSTSTAQGFHTIAGLNLIQICPELLNDEDFNSLALELNDRNIPNGIELKHRLSLFKEDNFRSKFLNELFGDASNMKINYILAKIFQKYFFVAPIKFQSFFYSVIFNPLFVKHISFFDGYFKTLNSLLNHINKDDIDEFYINFITESITISEKTLIFYYIAGGKSTYQFNYLIHRFGILDEIKLNTNFFATVRVNENNLPKYIDKVVLNSKSAPTN